jgi:hypothetical protein
MQVCRVALAAASVPAAPRHHPPHHHPLTQDVGPHQLHTCYLLINLLL